jgi:hypothetical protein
VTVEYVGGPLDGERATVPRGGIGPAGSRVVIVLLGAPSAIYVVHDAAAGLRWRYLPSAGGA